MPALANPPRKAVSAIASVLNPLISDAFLVGVLASADVDGLSRPRDVTFTNPLPQFRLVRASKVTRSAKLNVDSSTSPLSGLVPFRG